MHVLLFTLPFVPLLCSLLLILLHVRLLRSIRSTKDIWHQETSPRAIVWCCLRDTMFIDVLAEHRLVVDRQTVHCVNVYDIASNIFYTRPILLIVNCNECLSAEFVGQTPVPYKRIGKHFDLINRNSISDAQGLNC